MTKKHFKRLAAIISEHYRIAENFETPEALVSSIAGDIADMCQGENALFDRQRFLTACFK
jgi:hypothetical protein